MLKITVQPEPDRIRLKLEGNLAGMWVSEVEDSWRAIHAIGDDRPLYLDLTGVEHVDRAGRYLLGLLHCSGARLIASGVLMTELVRALKDDWPAPVSPPWT
jgi:anti-anti-sigma regulatory factor